MTASIEQHQYEGRRRVCEACGKGRRAAVHLRATRENSEMVAFTRRIVAAMGRRASADIDTIAEIVKLQKELDDQLDRAVVACHDGGYSWTEIADRLGITRQAAFKRWANR